LDAVLAVFPACDDAFAGVCSRVTSGLDESTVEAVCRLPHVVVGFIVQRGFAGGDVLTLERVVNDVLCRPEEGVYGVFEECGVVAVYIKRSGDSTPHLHILYVVLAILK